MELPKQVKQFLRGVRRTLPWLDYYESRDVVERQNIDQQLRYNRSPGYRDYMDRYNGQDIARAIIDRPANACWSGGVSFKNIINEDDSDKVKESKF